MAPADPPSRGARFVLATGIVLGLALLANLVTNRPHMLAANFEVYYVASEAAVAGEPFYDVAPERFPHFYYLYPPVTVVGFLPFVLVDPPIGFAIHTVVELAVALALAAVAIRWIERHRRIEAVDRALIAGFAVLSIHAVPSLFYGQVNLRMALLVAVGLFLLERSADPSGRTGAKARDRTFAGLALAGAALLKVFPAAVGVFLLRLRAWRAVGAAIATGLGGLVLGAVLFGTETTRRYFVDVLLPRGDGDAFVGGLDPTVPYVTVRRPLSILLPDLSPLALSALSALVLAPVLGYVYTELETPVDRLLAAHATLLAVLIYFPSYPLYYVLTFGTLLPALYLLADRPARLTFVAGAALANLVVTIERVRVALEPVPSAVAEPVLAAATPPLTVATPTLVGCLLMLSGCALHRYRRVR